MKRYISSLIAIIIFSCMFTVSASAAPLSNEVESNTLTNTELQNIIATTFPEDCTVLEKDIRSNSSTDNLSGERTLVDSETRDYSESIDVTRLEYSNGEVYYVTASEDVEFWNTGLVEGSNYSTYTVTLYIAYEWPIIETVSVTGINYTIYDYSSDIVHSFGFSSGSIPCTIRAIRYQENSAGPASAYYSWSGSDYYDLTYFSRILELRIGSNGRSYSIY